MQARFSNTFTDLLLFNAAHQFRSFPLQAFQLIAATLFASISWLTGRFITGLVVFVCVYIAVWLFQFGFNALYLYSRQNNQLIAHHTMTVGEDGLGGESSFSRSLYYWPGIVKVVERAGLLAVYVSPHTAYIVPARAFESPTQRLEFKSELLRRVHAAAPRAGV